MKKLLMVIAMALAGTLVAQDKAMTLADARGKIGDVIADPASMTSVMKQLSAADQTTYLADVNAAIAKMPGSAEEKTSKFLNVDAAALKGAKENNLTALVAEVFATVPPESLTAVNERFAADMKTRGIGVSAHYLCLHDSKYAKDRGWAAQSPEAERWAETIVRLPLFPGVDAATVAGEIADWCESAAQIGDVDIGA